MTKEPPFRETAVNHHLREIADCLDEAVRLQSRVMELTEQVYEAAGMSPGDRASRQSDRALLWDPGAPGGAESPSQRHSLTGSSSSASLWPSPHRRGAVEPGGSSVRGLRGRAPICGAWLIGSRSRSQMDVDLAALAPLAGRWELRLEAAVYGGRQPEPAFAPFGLGSRSWERGATRRGVCPCE